MLGCSGDRALSVLEVSGHLGIGRTGASQLENLYQGASGFMNKCIDPSPPAHPGTGLALDQDDTIKKAMGAT